jgi:FAD/FMN-containing dehydrogenase
VDLDLSDDQRLVLATTRRFLADRWPTSVVRERIGDGTGVDPGMLAGGAELGWTSMLVPEDLGGGTVSGEHGLGVVRSGWLTRQWGARAAELHGEIKRVFDPKNLLNPGKKLA